MKYSVIKIHPRYPGGEWTSTLMSDSHDREPEDTRPNALGFFWFNETTHPKAAFLELRDCIAQRHRREIERLKKSLKKLQELQYRD